MIKKPHFISIVIPVYNEEHNLPLLVEKIQNILHKIQTKYEIILINDGSTDNSKNEIIKLADNNKQIKHMHFNKNFGKAVALNKGFQIAMGELIITMDADLQDKPEEIPVLINKINEGYDLVSGWKINRKDKLEKKLPSKIFNYVIGTVTGLKIHDYNCGFKIYRKELTENINLYGEMHRYIPALAYWKGYRVGEVPVKHNYRKYGKSKYGMERYMHGLFDFMTVYFLIKYMSKPMHFFGKIGLFCSISGFLILSYLTIIWFFGERIGNRPLLSLGILLFILGIQFISTGLISELIIYLYEKKSNFK